MRTRPLSIFGLRVIKMVSGTARACGYTPRAVRRNKRRSRLDRTMHMLVRNSYIREHLKARR